MTMEDHPSNSDTTIADMSSTWFAPLPLAHRHHPHPHPHHEHIDSDFETEESDHMARIRRKKSTSSHHAKNVALCAITALMVLLLVGPYNFAYISGNSVKQSPHGNIRKSNQWISLEAQAFNHNNAAHNARNLIIVAGHSVTTSGHLEDADRDEADWFLLPYQRDRGLPQAIVAHIQAGLEAASNDPQSLLIFSGGETRARMGPETEGASYYRVTDAMNLWPPGGSSVRARTTTEEFATDSFQNLLFSICRYHEVTGKYPEKITVVSFTFKERRFATLHAAALQWPRDRFVYVGVDPSASTGFDLAESSKGEQENAAKPFESDPYGCHTTVLQEKRQERNPFYRTPPYELTCPELRELLNFCGPKIIPKSKLPW